MNFLFVILSEAKDLLFGRRQTQILRAMALRMTEPFEAGY